MIPNEVLTEELLQQAAVELATHSMTACCLPMNVSSKFSDEFEEKMQSLIKDIGSTCYTITIQDSVIHK